MVSTRKLNVGIFLFLCLVFQHAEGSTISKLAELAKGNSKRFQEQILEQKYQEYRKYAVLSTLLPSLDLTLSQRQAKDQVGLPPSNPTLSNKRRERSWGLTGRLPLFDYGKILNWQREDLVHDSKGLEIKEFEGLVFEQAAMLYVNYSVAKYKVYLLTKGLDLFERYLKKGNEGLRLKERIKSDIEMIKSNVFLLESRKNLEEQNFVEAKKRLINFIGGDEAKLEGLLSVDAENLLPVVEKVVEDRLYFYQKKKFGPKLDKGQILEKSLAMKKIQLNHSIDINEAKKVSADLLPKLELRASYNRSGDDWKDLEKAGNRDQSVGVYLNIPLIDGGGHFTKRKESSYRKSMAHLRRDISTETLYQEVRGTIEKFDFQIARIEDLKKYVEAKRQVRNLSQESFRLKRLRIDDLIIQENSYMDALTSYVESLSLTVESYFQLMSLVGRDRG